MSIKISELPQATSVGSSDIVPIVQGGTTKQATAGMISPIKAYTFSKVGDITTHNAGTTWTQFTADIVTEEIEAGEYLALMSYQVGGASSTGIVKLALWGDGNYIGGTLSTVPIARHRYI